MMNFKKIIKLLLVFIFTFIFLNIKVEAKEVNVYMFYGNTCPHCEEALKYLDSIKNKYDINIYKYEVFDNDDNRKLMSEISSYLDFNAKGVPFAIINNTPISGFSKNITSETYRYHIKKASKDDFIDKVGIKLGIVNEKEIKTTIKTENDNNKMEFKIPIIGKIDLKGVSLPIVSVLLGLVDGFNPCAMWILLFLISTLIGLKNKKRLWILGITFLLTSSLVYLLFMLSWLSFAKMISGVVLVRTIIAIVALIGGSLNLNSFANSLTKDDGCTVVNAKRRNKIFSKIRKFTQEKSFVFAILGIIALAASVNLIELACSAGLPVIFTQLLAMNDLTNLQYFIYILIYVLCFMFDDLIIFAIAVKTMELTGISTKYSKYSHLIGGVLMFIIGILLLVKPEWLMFNF